MAVSANYIFRGDTPPGVPIITDSFRDIEVIVFHAPDVPLTEGFEFSASLVAVVPRPGILGGFQTVNKAILFTDEAFTDTAYMYRLPYEFLSQDLDYFLVIETDTLFTLEVWTLSTDCGLNEICEKQDFNNNILTLLAARQLVGDVVALGQFVTNVVRLLEGDVTALPGVLLPIAGPVIDLLPGGVGEIFEGEVIEGGGLFDINPDELVTLFQ